MGPSNFETDVAHDLRERYRHRRKRNVSDKVTDQEIKSRGVSFNKRRRRHEVYKVEEEEEEDSTMAIQEDVIPTSKINIVHSNTSRNKDHLFSITKNSMASKPASSSMIRNDSISENGMSQSPSSSPSVFSSSIKETNKNNPADLFSLDNYLMDIIKMITPTAVEHQERLRAIESMKRVLEPLGLTVEVYGSLTTGLSTPASDIDMVMKPEIASQDTADHHSVGKGGRTTVVDVLAYANTDYPTPMQKAKIASCIKIVGNTLRHRSRGFTRILTITRARVPIVKCETTGYGSSIKIDLSFDKSGLATSSFLCKSFSKKGNECARAITTLVKLILASAELNDPSVGGLGSFPTAVMVLFFFEVHVQRNIPAELSRSLGVLLTSFLKFYGVDFDFKHEGIDYAHRRSFKKPPTNALFVTNPLLPGTNCASSATIFELRIKPLFARTADCLSHLLHAHTQRVVVEGKLRPFFSIAVQKKNKNGSSSNHHKDPSASFGEPHHQKANIWDSNGLYCGAILERD